MKINKSTSSYLIFAERVAEMLNIDTVEHLESVYGDFIFECYEANDDAEGCYRFCTFEDEDYDKEDEEDINSLH